jgi:hypothetical protein
MNGYARVSEIMADVAGISAKPELVPVYVRLCDEISREFESESQRRFYYTISTKVFDGPPGGAFPYVNSGRYVPTFPGEWYGYGYDRRRSLLLFEGQDLLTVTSMAVDQDADGVYETMLTIGSDAFLWPNNPEPNEPYRGIQLNPLGSLIAYPTGPRRVQIAGVWGYSQEAEATGQTIQDALGIDTSVTAITVLDGSAIDPGDTLVIDAEQMDVASVTPTVVTVTRAINGTTAAIHANGTAISRRRFPRDVENAVKERVVGRRWDTQSGFAGSEILSGNGMPSNRASYARWQATIQNYRNPASVL